MRVTVWVSEQPERKKKRATASRRGFTLLDVLVSMAVISVLIGLMLPALTAIRETTRKVVCSSNIRQIGIATATYTDDYRGMLPYSRFYEKSYQTGQQFLPQELMMARVGDPTNKWDGLGLLFAHQYCSAAQVFYCPSHRSYHRYDNYTQGWAGGPVDVFTNFQYRGGNSSGQNNIAKLQPRMALMADGMASMFDFNHALGGNVFASDLSVAWYDDSARGQQLPFGYDDPDGRSKLQTAWSKIDESLRK